LCALTFGERGVKIRLASGDRYRGPMTLTELPRLYQV